MKSLALYTPYELVPGGGERYLLSIAEAAGTAFKIFLVTPRNVTASQIAAVGDGLGVRAGHVTPISPNDVEGKFDVAIVLGNEALPAIPPLAHRNVFLCQFPYPIPDQDIVRRIEFIPHYHCIVVYSEYVRTKVLQAYAAIGRTSPEIRVVHPPVAPVAAGEKSLTRRRRGSILSVGRFFTGGHCKRQDALILAFRSLLYQTNATLHLAGTIHSDPPHLAYYQHCRELARDLPITFYPNTSREMIGQLYAECDCYWHGAGLGADPETAPGDFEHFGISVVEAMAAGCLPFVVDHGGPASIVTPAINGWTYRTADELVSRSADYLRGAKPTRIWLQRHAARLAARKYRPASFRKKWQDLWLGW